MIFGDIYTAKKYRYEGKYDFPVDTMENNTVVGAQVGGMKTMLKECDGIQLY